jgi:hypothetical protein
MGISPCLPFLRLRSAFFVGPALRRLVVEKEVVLDKQSIGTPENHFNAFLIFFLVKKKSAM